MSGSSGRGPPGEGSGGEGSPSGEGVTKTKGKSKSKLGAFKSLREVSRSGSFRIGSKKKNGDEGSGDSLAGDGSESGKMASKKRSDEGSATNVKELEERESGASAEGAVSTKKKKKKKGSSLVRKLSSKYRNRLSSTEAAKKVDTLTEETDASLSLAEAATISLPEDDEEEDLRSVGSGVSTATGSTGGGTQSRASDNPPTMSSLSGPTMSSSTSSSASVGTPPSVQEPSPDTKFSPPEPKDGRSSPGSVSPTRSYLPLQTPSSFPTTFPLYYKPSQTSSIVRRSITPPFQPPSTSHRGRPEASSPVWGVRPRGPLGLSIKTRDHEEVTYSFSSTKESEKIIGSENAGGAEGPQQASESTDKEEGEGEGGRSSSTCGGEERIGEEAPPTAVDDEHIDSQEPSLLRSGSEATDEKCIKVEVAKEEQGKGAGEVGKEEEAALEKEEKVEGAVGEGAPGSGEVSGEATVEQPLEESPETGAQGVERRATPPEGEMDETPETSTVGLNGSRDENFYDSLRLYWCGLRNVPRASIFT
ncbi:hypothetical protein J437_LFUL001379 [Ladona fulva]|uniref:Uncharacterized protein n=1 Tax=Ladona fulva TaxID=123851 RepID=A0A8K0JYH6_LADFU|nr:hypothetical protein J437_LFUL001379 [Ladona fulva]